jgi:CheY-like chemotaxis protein
VGQLVGGISHDFNNLLAGIMSFSRLIQDELKGIAITSPTVDLDQVGHDVQQIVRATERAGSLIRQLLLFGQQNVVAPQILDMNSVVSDMVDLLRRTLGEQTHLVTDLTKPLGSVCVDVSHFEQILMNLVVNAGDAMPSGGSLSLRTYERTLDEAYAEANGIEAGEYVALSVSDTGSGMLPEVIERAFEARFSTKPAGEGSGLGLATVYGIVTGSGGHISIDSEMGEGTTVTVYLPEVEGHAAPVAGTRPAVGVVAGETILLVEDEEIVREPAARLLRNAGYVVLDAADADHAIELAQAHEGTIGLLLTDVVLPGMMGVELAEKLLHSTTIERVLYTTGYSEKAIGPGASVEAGSALLAKPFTAEKLLEVVRNLLDSHHAD